MAQPDFLIVGGGVVGLTTAQALLREGYRVTVAERGVVGAEASWAGGGILYPLCPWDYCEAVTRLALASMDRFGEAAAALHSATGIDPEYQPCGMLVLPPFRQLQAVQWCRQHQFPLESATPSELLSPVELDHALHRDALFLPMVAQVRNPRLMRALRAKVEMHGCEILEQCEIRAVDVSGDSVSGMQTSRGRLVAGAYIIAAGAWSKHLLGALAGGMEIRPIRGQMLLFKFDVPPLSHIVLRESLYIIPRLDGHVLVGSTLEDAGFDKATTSEAKAALLQQLWKIFPEWRQHEPVKHWSGFRPGSPDNIPTIGRHPCLTNLYANSGHFRYGVTMSFASAELLLNEILKRPQSIPAAPYSWR